MGVSVRTYERTIGGVTFSVKRHRKGADGRTYWQWTVLAPGVASDTGTDLSTPMGHGSKRALAALIGFAAAAADPGSGYDGDVFSAAVLAVLAPIADELAMVEEDLDTGVVS